MAQFTYVDLDEEAESEPELYSESKVEIETDGPIDIHVINNQNLDSKDYIDIYAINRNHIREQSKSVIPACGFLLTGAFGLLYFIFKGDNNRIPIHPVVIVLLAFAAIVLAASIIASIKSVQAASSSRELPETRDEQLDFILDIYDEEYNLGKWSIRLLGSAIGIFIIIILYFSYEYLVNMLPVGSTSSSIQNVIIIPIPGLI